MRLSLLTLVTIATAYLVLRIGDAPVSIDKFRNLDLSGYVLTFSEGVCTSCWSDP